MWSWVKNKFFLRKEDKLFYTLIRPLIGFIPSDLSLYLLACTHKSSLKPSTKQSSNERLEYLGDALLGAVVADYLFTKYPIQTEGYLSEQRAKIVSRRSLNVLADKLKIRSVLRYDKKNSNTQQVILGNAVEAIIGAIYLDKGYQQCKKFIIYTLILPHLDIEKLIQSDTNYKSKIIKWAQRNNKAIRFESTISYNNNRHGFMATVLLTEKIYGKGLGHSKKKAEQDAAHKTCIMLGLS